MERDSASLRVDEILAVGLDEAYFGRDRSQDAPDCPVCEGPCELVSALWKREELVVRPAVHEGARAEYLARLDQQIARLQRIHEEEGNDA
jgi:hypothetical protein